MILIISSSSASVGVSHSTFRVARLLADNGKQVIVGCPEEGWLTAKLQTRNIPFVVFGHRPRPLSAMRASLRVLRFLFSNSNIQTVYLNGRITLLITAPAVLIGRWRVVVTLRETLKLKAKGLLSWKAFLNRVLLESLVDEISCVSKALAASVGEALGRNVARKCRVLPNFVFEEECDSPRGGRRVERGHTRHLVFVGRLQHEKGPDLLLDAMARLVDNGWTGMCDIIGEGPMLGQLRRQTIALGLKSQVRFLGGREDAAKLIADYDILVVPSRHESFGRVVLEGWAAHVPLIASRVGGMAELVTDGLNALTVEPCSSKEISIAIERLSVDEELCERLRNGGKASLGHYQANANLFERYNEFIAGIPARNNHTTERDSVRLCRSKF